MKIRITKSIQVTAGGVVIQRLEVGDIVEATYDAGHYWVACPPVFKAEGVLLAEEHVSDHEFYD